ncbi:MAG: response regulator [Candidatus Parcubacteria bacterium]|nr:response regulator [Burkholderiales bacterium]
MNAPRALPGSRLLRGIRYSIRSKLMLMVAATTLVALLIAGAAMVIYDLRTFQDSWERDLATQAEILGRASAPALAFEDRKVALENLSLLSVRPMILSGAIYTSQGTLFATYARADLRNAVFPAQPGEVGIRREGEELVLFRRIVDRNEAIGMVYLRAQYDMTERLWAFLKILGVVIALSLLVAVWVSSWLQSAVTQPILEITDVARQVHENRDFALRASKTTEDEIGYLVDTFNAMLAEVGRRADELQSSHQLLEHEMAERRGAEDALRVADRLKDEFLATLAHELRNPLAPLRNSLQILKMAPDDKAVVRQAREVMERQLRQLVRLVDDLLDISRITTGKFSIKRERTDLEAIVERALETAKPLIAARDQQLEVKLPREPVQLEADPTRLAQVFTNLLNNASKFSAKGSAISLQAALEGTQVVVTVADNGIGIAPHMLPSIFQMFVQADRSLDREQAGLGVGLSLAKYLVELHGGTISASSAGAGSGSSFSVHLPVVAGARDDRVLVAGAAAGGRGPSRRVLLADDNEDFAASMAMMLKALGHEVRVANDGAAALAEAEAFKPEFAFLDIGLPKLNGYELARRVRALSSKPPYLVAVTGWGQEDDKRRASEAGFDQHMVKPVELDQVRAVLARTPSSA